VLLKRVGIAQPTSRAEDWHAQGDRARAHDRAHLGEVEGEAAKGLQPTGVLPV